MRRLVVVNDSEPTVGEPAVATRSSINSPNPLLQPDLCWSPALVKVQEPFQIRLVGKNDSPDRGEGYVETYIQGKSEGPRRVFSLWAHETFEISFSFADLQRITGKLEKSQVVDFAFVVGYFGGWPDYPAIETDTWKTSVYVEVTAVKKEFAMPWWGFALGGVAVIGLVMVLAKR